MQCVKEMRGIMSPNRFFVSDAIYGNLVRKEPVGSGGRLGDSGVLDEEF